MKYLIIALLILCSCGKHSDVPNGERKIRAKELSYTYGTWHTVNNVELLTLDTMYRVGDTIIENSSWYELIP